MTFKLDPRIADSTHLIADWSLSQVLLKDNKHFPWILLVPKVSEGIVDIDQLSNSQQAQLTQEINKASKIMRDYFDGTKLNVGALGNIVRQLHIHIVVRKEGDAAWPHSVWQAGVLDEPYSDEMKAQLVKALQKLC